MYLLGEAIFKPEPRKRFKAPIGQANLCLKILRETDDLEAIKEKLRGEYLAIAFAMYQMGIDFSIVCSHLDETDGRVVAVCKEALGCKICAFDKDYFPPSVMYPRDFTTVLPGLVLVNPYVEIIHPEKDGRKVVSSPFGQGGRIHVAKNVAVVCERVIVQKGSSREVNASELAPLQEIGISSCLMPAHLVGVIINGQISNRFFSNDHIDRVSVLLEAQDGGLHLVMDPRIMGANWQGGDKNHPWNPIFPEAMVSLMRERCDPFGITVHLPERLSIPYILNLIQFSDGRVLMSSGDPEVESLIRSIVGQDKVFTTEVPIRYFPTWHYAGIRCLIGDYAEVLFKKAH